MGVSKGPRGCGGRGVAQGPLQGPLPLWEASGGGRVAGSGVLGSNCPSVPQGSSATLTQCHPPGFHGKKSNLFR